MVLDPEPEPPRRRRGFGWLLGLLLLIVLLLLLLLRGCGDDDDGASDNAATGAATTEQVETGETEAGDGGSDDGGEGGSAGGGAGSLTTEGGEDVFAALIGSGALETFEGQSVEGNAVPVHEVVNETGVWVGAAEDDRIFVEIEGEDGAGIDVQAGDTVTFTGVIEQNLEAETYGLREEGGAQQFRDQGYHVQVQAADIATP